MKESKTLSIVIKNLRKKLDGHDVLNDVNLDIVRGETVVIIGKSGGGKSVLLRHIMGLMRPDSGQIYVENVAITSLNERELDRVRLKLGMLFQEGALFDSMSVYDNVAFPLREHEFAVGEDLDKRINEYLTKVGMEHAAHLFPEQLSGGMAKRVGLARALVMEPQIMLYDEPTAGIDLLMKDEINGLIRSLNQEFGVTALVVTHDIESALKVGDRIALLDDGRISAIGTPEEISQLDHPVARKIGEMLQLRN